MSKSSASSSSHEAWGSRIGLILAMAGNAVGLGNFLRFPRQATVNGGGAFMITYFVAFLLLGIPLMWIEWGVGRHGGRFRKGHIPGMFASLWKHPAAKYLGALGLAIPTIVLIYYAYIESWTLAFTFFSATKSYWGHTSQSSMVQFLQSFQNVVPGEHAFWEPFVFFFITVLVNFYVVSKGIAGGIEKLAKVGMPILFFFAVVLVIAVLTQPAGPGGHTALQGLNFIYNPDFSKLGDASVWLASAGQIFFTLSVGMGTLQAYASYLSSQDDIALSGIATAATNEATEVVLGGTIAIPAAVTFFGVTGAVAVAQSGSYNLGFATMPVIFQQMPFGAVLGFMWFGLLFFAGITSSVAMATPVMAFMREEFGFQREKVAWTLCAVVVGIGILHILFLGHGFLDEWDYWAGTFGLVIFAVIETVLFMWVFKPENAWRELHLGADIRIPKIFKFIMTVITPAYLFFILIWWGATDAVPILLNEKAAGGGILKPGDEPYILASRLIMVAIVITFLVLIRIAWKRNGYDDRAGFEVQEDRPLQEGE